MDFSNLKRDWDRFSKKFLGTQNKLGTKKGKRTVGNSETSNTPVQSTDIDEQIKELIEKNEFLANGRVSFVNLGKIKDKLGSKWSKYETSIYQFAEKVIERRITPQDLYYRVGEDVYVFVFATLTQEEAVLKCSLIAKEIGEQIFGKDWASESFGTSVAVSQGDGSILLKEMSVSECIFENLKNAETINPQQAISSAAPCTAQDTMEKIAQGLATVERLVTELNANNHHDVSSEETAGKFSEVINNLGNLDAQLSDTIELSKINSDSPKWETFIHEIQKDESSGLESLSGKLSNMFSETEKLYATLQDQIFPDVTEDQPVTEETDTEADEEPDMTFSYMPFSQPSISRIHSYRISADILIENSLWRVEDLPEDLDPGTIAVFDQLLLRRALVDLHDCLHQDLVNVLIIPVHYSTLNIASHRKAYLEICNTIPKNMRKLLTWEINNSGVQSWHSQLLNAVSAVKKYCRMICLECDLDHPHFRDLRAIGVDVVGFNWHSIGGNTPNFASKMELFCKRAEQEGLKTYLIGVPTSTIRLACLNAGVDFMGGPAIADFVDYPGGVIDLDFAKAFGDILESQAEETAISIEEIPLEDTA